MADSKGGMANSARNSARPSPGPTPPDPTELLRHLQVVSADELAERLSASLPFGELFVSPNVAFAFSVFELLDVSERQAFAAAVREYASGLMAAGPGEDEDLAACARALWQARELNEGQVPSEDCFEELRREFKRLRWPAGSTIRARLGRSSPL